MEVSERDQKLLETRDMKPMSWQESKEIAQIGDLTLYRRSPEQLHKYLLAKQRFQQECGGTGNYILTKKLKWEGQLDSGNEYLSSKNDVLVLENDFPYFFEPGIDHLVVWSKVRCECGPDEQPTPQSATKIENFIAKTFGPLGISGDDIMWFKNTVSLQSVPTVEHFHILVRKKGWESVVGTAGCLETESCGD